MDGDNVYKQTDQQNDQIEAIFLPDIFQAAQMGRDKKVKAYIDKGGAVDAKDGHGATLLMHAAWGGHPKIVKFLLDSGADLNVHDNSELSPLDIVAMYSESVECARILLDHGADLNDQDSDGFSVLMTASSSNLELVKLLVGQGADINHQDNKGDTAIHSAMDGLSTEEIVQFLLDHGADKTIRNQDGKTALDIMLEEEEFFQDPGIIRLLQE